MNFQHALARRPAPNMADGLTESSHLGPPDIALAMQQYDAYLDALRACGLAVRVLDVDDRFPDGHFVEDPAVIYGDLAFICRPADPSRRDEGAAIAVQLPSQLRQIHTTGQGAFIEGGDVLVCADQVLIGLGSRTNEAGAIQLKDALHSVAPDLPVYLVVFSGVLHLKSGLTELAPGVFVQDPQMQHSHDLAGTTLMLPPEEGYAANVLPMNGKLLIAAGCPTLLEYARRYYDDREIIVVDKSEFHKMDGGLTCMSLRY